MAVFRNCFFAELFGHLICHVSLALDSAHSKPPRSDFILHPQVCHINVLQSTNSLSVEAVFGRLRINGLHWLHLVTQISFNSDVTPVNSDASSAPAFSSASALLLVRIFCLHMNAFSLWLCGCRAVQRLRSMNFEFLCSLPYVNLKMSSLLRPFFHS